MGGLDLVAQTNLDRHAARTWVAAARQELLGGQHVPDGLGHSAGDVDSGDLDAALQTSGDLSEREPLHREPTDFTLDLC
jgi:hypothetical protein